MRNELKTAAFLPEGEAVHNQLKPRSREQNVIQSRLNFPSSQCCPVGGASSWVVRVHHHHVLILAELGQALAIAVRFHKVTLSAARHGFSLQIQCLPFRMAHISDSERSSRSLPQHSIERVRHVPFCQLSRTAGLSPSRHVEEGRAPISRKSSFAAFDPYDPSSPLYTSLWSGHFTDLPYVSVDWVFSFRIQFAGLVPIFGPHEVTENQAVLNILDGR